MRLHDHSRCADLLALANDAEVADLIAMQALARERLLPALPAGPAATGMTFDGSTDLNANADLIAVGLLVDVKAGQGDPPRAYALRTVDIYAVRFGHLATWPLAELGERMGGRRHHVKELRADFADVTFRHTRSLRDSAGA